MSTETKPIAFLTAEETKVKEVKDGKDSIFILNNIF
jgi:hypothetical protein